jgi:hypothetical protein
MIKRDNPKRLINQDVLYIRVGDKIVEFVQLFVVEQPFTEWSKK